jgi:hypothetical protein
LASAEFDDGCQRLHNIFQFLFGAPAEALASVFQNFRY